ncbi:hypothetical protein [Gracilibacillus xinjiangensis]|uniref:Gas vesicle protein GvpP n=1 Tax=Gracilibacillus xinjiangensis TaxID=1193282 RepID=A0ABV8WZA4_9BACI
MAEQESQHSNDQKSDQTSIKYILLGGAAGAGVGLLSNPGTVQKLCHRVQESETGQLIAKELGRNLQQLISQQVMATVQQAAPNYWNKAKRKFSSSESQQSEGNETEKGSNFEEIKQENKQINQRLESIEKKLDELQAKD